MMTGMLVPVAELEDVYSDEEYAPVDKAAVAVNTLFGVDPDFVEFCKTLYGDDVDPVDIWLDVYKANPTGPDMMTPSKPDRRKKVLEASGIGATVIGGALGVKEVGEQAPKAMRALRGGKRGKALLVPAARTLGVGAMLGGDAAATGMQVSAARQKRRGHVEKVSIPGVHAMAEGIESGIRGKLIPRAKAFGSDVKRGATGQSMQGRKGPLLAVPKTPTAGYRAGQAVAGTPKRRLIATGATAGAGGVMAGRASKRADDDVSVTWAGEFTKFDTDKRLVFGWASVVELNGTPVVDRQGDYIHPDDLENASYEYVIKSRVGGDMHRRHSSDIPVKVSDLVESMVFTPEKVAKMGLPAEAAEKIPTGWWVGFKVHDDETWDLVKKRGRGGFSIHGRGKRVEKNLDELVPGYH